MSLIKWTPFADLEVLQKENIDIQVSADSVAITGERKSEETKEENGVTRSEFHYGRFQRIIPLPARVQNATAAAEYKDGILNLHLPKDVEEQKRVVKVPLQ